MQIVGKEIIFRSRSSCPCCLHSARRSCKSLFPRQKILDMEKKFLIPTYLNPPKDPDQRSTTLSDPGSGRRVSVDPSSVDGRILKTKCGII
ncbi:hypothetical protein NPIL_155721 [Nephila pilipes]|uniref:Uncharacterized protein n=1 Tax=Nephila pilipes TaxID=299642 RepID=A0A8X6PCK5_NEPPI|nr:hypothetical protein NPIL_155721 [Nephila pilipes]